jgi:signal transduction histidine kinase
MSSSSKIPSSIENITPESLNLLVSTVQELSLARDLETVMRIVRTAARNLTGADGATFVLRDGELCHYADEDAISPLWKGSRFPITACISGWVMLNAKAAVIDDIYMDFRVPADAYRPTFVKSLVMVPIRTIDPVGAIGNYWAQHIRPTEQQVWLLQSLADVTAVTMENIRIYAELEQRVKDRTQQLETINKELEALSYTISHDLKAPLRIINGFIDLTVEDHAEELSDEGKRKLARIQERGVSLSQMIDDMLIFFKTATREPHKSTVSMKALAYGIAEDIKRHERARNIDFIIHDLPEASVDPALIKHAWYNLISNAVKYTGTRDKTVIEIGAEKKGEITYFVKDNGVGFDMRYYNKLFGVFQRLHSSNEFEGTGIGLASVQRIIHRHGGKVWANAKIGEGATFYFTLPG